MPQLPEGPALDLLRDALRVEADGQRALLAGDREAAAARLTDAAGLYRRSWEAAAPGAYGRLIGMLKAAILAGDAADAAAYVREQIPETQPESPAAAYAAALACLVQDDRALTTAAVAPMLGASPAFERAGTALAAIATGDGATYADAVRAIVEDFEGRDEHLTGVPIADTALMLERLAEPHGLAAGVRSPLLPAPV